MARWQRRADRAALDVAPPRADPDDVALTDLDPALCAIRGWQ